MHRGKYLVSARARMAADEAWPSNFLERSSVEIRKPAAEIRLHNGFVWTKKLASIQIFIDIRKERLFTAQNIHKQPRFEAMCAVASPNRFQVLLIQAHLPLTTFSFASSRDSLAEVSR